MINKILTPEIKRLLKERDNTTLIEFFSDIHARQAAEFLETLEISDIWSIIAILETHDAAGIFSYFEIDFQLELVKEGKGKPLKDLLEDLSSDDRADLFKAMLPEDYERTIAFLSKEEKEDVEELIAHKEGTAGAVMSTDYAYCFVDQVVKDIFFYLRQHGESKETVYYIYVVDEHEILHGVVSLKDAVMAQLTDRVNDIMTDDLITVRPDEDQEEVADIIKEYDLIALPVVDENNTLLGIITHDDVFDIVQEEQTEDVERMMGIAGEVEDRDYLDVPVSVHFKKRLPWVLALFLIGNVSSLVIGFHESLIHQVVILSFFFSLLTGTGGNTGAQAASVILRSLTLNGLTDSDFAKVLLKEFSISLLVAMVLFFFMYLRVYVFYGDLPDYPIWRISLAISVALAVQVVSSTLIGAALPMLAQKAKMDPAVVAMPAITTLVDITGLLIYLSIARLILGL